MSRTYAEALEEAERLKTLGIDSEDEEILNDLDTLIQQDPKLGRRLLPHKPRKGRKKLEHGLAHSPAWRSWQAMISRCYQPSNVGYHNYGGRGITVCPQWQYSFETFFQDMGPRPTLKHQLDRINNDGNYEPSNCRWATQREQARNRRTSIMLTLRGETKCVADWAATSGQNVRTILYRIAGGWDVEKAVFLPSIPRKERRWNASWRDGESPIRTTEEIQRNRPYMNEKARQYRKAKRERAGNDDIDTVVVSFVAPPLKSLRDCESERLAEMEG